MCTNSPPELSGGQVERIREILDLDVVDRDVGEDLSANPPGPIGLQIWGAGHLSKGRGDAGGTRDYRGRRIVCNSAILDSIPYLYKSPQRIIRSMTSVACLNDGPISQHLEPQGAVPCLFDAVHKVHDLQQQMV